MKTNSIVVTLAFLLSGGIALAQSARTVEATLKSGTVITGELISYNPLTEMVISVTGIQCTIPAGEISQLKEISVTTEKPNAVTKPLEQNNLDAFPEVDLESYHGFLLEKGNCVCIVANSDANYELAAVDELKRSLKEKGYWTVVDKPEQAHFILQYAVNLKGQDLPYVYLRTRQSYYHEKHITHFRGEIGNYDIPGTRPVRLYIKYVNESCERNIEHVRYMIKHLWEPYYELLTSPDFMLRVVGKKNAGMGMLTKSDFSFLREYFLLP